MKRYVELETAHGANFLKIETYYSLGGYNCFTGRSEDRGYYLSVSPVERSRTGYGGATMESYAAFSGVKKCVKAVSRQSKKAAEQAEENALNYIHELVICVCDKNGLPVPVEFTRKEV